MMERACGFGAGDCGIGYDQADYDEYMTEAAGTFNYCDVYPNVSGCKGDSQKQPKANEGDSDECGDSLECDINEPDESEFDYGFEVGDYSISFNYNPLKGGWETFHFVETFGVGVATIGLGIAALTASVTSCVAGPIACVVLIGMTATLVTTPLAAGGVALMAIAVSGYIDYVKENFSITKNDHH
jgi:hypothetical protein